ncbi:MAG TPA: cation-transporting P-type ATPase [Streptosporangiaceae bacterium]
MQSRLIDVPGAERQALAPEAAWHTLSAEEVLRAEEADPRHGLSSAEAASRADRFGPNTVLGLQQEGEARRHPPRGLHLDSACAPAVLWQLSRSGTGKIT